ncbi:hypothetical protein [Sphingomonas insulae]|uniref:hypothetical protein n=1 Tax=Sphingomonas insulae TaxID=424800 RepID=UPI002011ACBF|nr:hypothetical protein [Sphingomonas insulae]
MFFDLDLLREGSVSVAARPRGVADACHATQRWQRPSISFVARPTSGCWRSSTMTSGRSV